MTVCTKLNFGKYLIILQNVVYICIFNIKFYLISPVFQEREGEPVSYTSFCQNQICESASEQYDRETRKFLRTEKPREEGDVPSHRRGG